MANGKLILPQRMTNPLYRAKRYVDMRAGMPDPAREERHERVRQLSAREPVVGRTGSGSSAPVGGGAGSLGLADPGADRILFWDESGNALAWLTPGDGLAIDTTTIRRDELLIVQTADYTGTSNSAAAQKFFNTSTNGAATVAASTLYRLDAKIHLHTTDTDSSTVSILFGGTATLSWIGFSCQAVYAATETFGTPVETWITVATATQILAATATAKHLTITYDGYVSVNATGTFIPQYQFGSANQSSPVTLRGSYLRLIPTASTIGAWT